MAIVHVDAWLQAATQQLLHSGIESARLDAELLLAHVVDRPRTWILAHGDDLLDDESLTTLATLLAQRADNEPLAYLTGQREFYGREFAVSRSVLVPRPETEVLIEHMAQLDVRDGDTIIDVGTGSGCIAVTLALEHPKTHVIATDISPDALTVAAANAQRLRSPSIECVESDLLAALPTSRKARFIVANLPYVDREWEVSPTIAYEPALALYALQHGLALIYQLVDQAPLHLSPKGYLLLEADPRQHDAIVDYAAHTFVERRRDGFIVVLQLQS
jgi:release factor glutamine methyltransferase